MITGTKHYQLLVGDAKPNFLAGVVAEDDLDGAVGVDLIESVDLTKAGVYKLIYKAKDRANNESIITRFVIVNEVIPDLPGDDLTRTETFTNFKGSGQSYVDETFTGVSNITWKVTKGRKDLAGYDINGGGIIFQKDGTLSATVSGGVSALKVDLKKAFSGSMPSIEIYINSAKVGTYTLKNSGQVETYTLENLKINGDFKLEIKVIGERLTMANLTLITSTTSMPEAARKLMADVNNLSISDFYPVSANLNLPNKGSHGSTITWHFADPANPNNQFLDLNQRTVTVPTDLDTSVPIYAQIQNGDYQYFKLYTIYLGKTDAKAIKNIYDLSDQTTIQIKGVITNVYLRENEVHFFVQDETGAIRVIASRANLDQIKIGQIVSLTGTKSTVNSEVRIKDVVKISPEGKQSVAKTTLDNPSLLPNYQGQLVKLSGLLKQSFTDKALIFSLINTQGVFELSVPNDLENRLAIVNLLANQAAGLCVEVVGNVIRDGSKYQILVTNPDDLVVADAVDLNQIKTVFLAHFKKPVFPNKVKTDIVLPEYIDAVISGVRVTWTSDKPGAVNHDGTVTQSEKDVTVTLTYTIKYNGQTLDTGTITVVVAAISNYDGYYATINNLTGDALKQELKRIITNGYKGYSYKNTSNIIAKSDVNPNQPNLLYLIYNSGSADAEWDNATTWNKEHVWPESKLGNASNSDLHNLRAADPEVNRNRGNDPFARGSGSYKSVSGGWYPGDDHRGDVARIVLYMNTRWGLNITKNVIGELDMFLEWHKADPVDNFERNRNNVIYEYQKNRNPYIDHPELVDAVYGNGKIARTPELGNYFDQIIYLSKLIAQVDLGQLRRNYIM